MVQEFKNALKEQRVVRKETPWSRVKLDDLAAKTVKVDGKVVQLGDPQFDQLMKLVGMPSSFIKRLDEDFSPAFASKMSSTLVDKMKNKDGNVTFLADINRGRVVGVTPNSNMVSNNTAIQMLDAMPSVLLDNVVDYTINPTFGGQLKIELPTEHSLANELFKTGIVIDQTLEGLHTIGSTQRLVCSNGMLAPFADTRIQMLGSSAESVRTFITKLEKAIERDFIPKFLERTIEDAKLAPVSYSEYVRIRNKVGKVLSEDQKQLLNTWFPIDYLHDAFKKELGEEKFKKTDYKKGQSLQTDQSMYSVINAATFVETHIAPSMKLRKFIGDQFVSSYKWDFKPSPVNPFGNRWNERQQFGLDLVPENGR